MAVWMGKINRANLKKTFYYLQRNGLRRTYFAVKERAAQLKDLPYVYEEPTEETLEKQRKEAENYSVTFSIVVPTFRTHPVFFRELVRSLLEQSYPNWELILADASDDDSVEREAANYKDSRIHYVKLGKNEGIAGNTNLGLKWVTGDYTGLLDHDDLLTKDALFLCAKRIEEEKKKGNICRLLYSDEDKCDQDATTFFEPNFKEDFNLDLLLSNNYICHFMVLKSDLIKELGFRKEYDGAQDFDLVLRAANRLWGREEEIAHISRVLYHWRCHLASTAENPQSKRYAYEAGGRAILSFLEERDIKGKVLELPHLGFYRVEYGPDLFAARKDIGAVGGKLIKKGKVIGGRMNEKGEVYFLGLPKAFSGYLHRSVLQQDSDAVDIRKIRVRKECLDLFEKTVGVAYTEGRDGLFDAKTLPKDMDCKERSVALGKALRENGYRILWDPML